MESFSFSENQGCVEWLKNDTGDITNDGHVPWGLNNRYRLCLYGQTGEPVGFNKDILGATFHGVNGEYKANLGGTLSS